MRQMGDLGFRRLACHLVSSAQRVPFALFRVPLQPPDPLDSDDLLPLQPPDRPRFRIPHGHRSNRVGGGMADMERTAMDIEKDDVAAAAAEEEISLIEDRLTMMSTNDLTLHMWMFRM